MGKAFPPAFTVHLLEAPTQAGSQKERGLCLHRAEGQRQRISQGTGAEDAVETSKLCAGGGWWVWLSVQGGVSLQRSSDLNVPGSEGNVAKPSEQGPLWKSGADSQG